MQIKSSIPGSSSYPAAYQRVLATAPSQILQPALLIPQVQPNPPQGQQNPPSNDSLFGGNITVDDLFPQNGPARIPTTTPTKGQRPPPPRTPPPPVPATPPHRSGASYATVADPN